MQAMPFWHGLATELQHKGQGKPAFCEAIRLRSPQLCDKWKRKFIMANFKVLKGNALGKAIEGRGEAIATFTEKSTSLPIRLSLIWKNTTMQSM
ncbi:hypothetical protein HGG76_11665 [Ochrobactrum tritici]|uniref:Uncharacterized protein n=1 Tax=Brucella tritici TaxID=94626 RepID=A0A7X6JCX4_9HYPH|nr:hypothetical protein [Brucella tritici]